MTSIGFDRRVSLRWPGLAVAGLLVFGVGTGLAARQGAATPAQTAAGVTVDLGTADGPPGRTVAVPMNIGVPDGVSVTAAEVEVRFDKALVEFLRVDVTPEGTAGSVTVTQNVEKEPDEKGRAILKLKISAPQPLRSMAIADLAFRINPSARPPAGSTGHKAAKLTAVLTRRAQVKTGAGDGTLAAAEGRDGEIDITAGTAIFGCFFYMH